MHLRRNYVYFCMPLSQNEEAIASTLRVALKEDAGCSKKDVINGIKCRSRGIVLGAEKRDRLGTVRAASVPHAVAPVHRGRCEREEFVS